VRKTDIANVIEGNYALDLDTNVNYFDISRAYILGLRGLDEVEKMIEEHNNIHVMSDRINIFSVAAGIRKSAAISRCLSPDLLEVLDIKQEENVFTFDDVLIYSGELITEPIGPDVGFIVKNENCWGISHHLFPKEVQKENIQKLLSKKFIEIHDNPHRVDDISEIFKVRKEIWEKVAPGTCNEEDILDSCKTYTASLEFSWEESILDKCHIYNGRLLNYPKCCIDAFVKCETLQFDYEAEWIHWLPHAPCSSNCIASRKLSKKVKDSLMRCYPKAYQHVKEHYKKGILEREKWDDFFVSI